MSQADLCREILRLYVSVRRLRKDDNAFATLIVTKPMNEDDQNVFDEFTKTFHIPQDNAKRAVKNYIESNTDERSLELLKQIKNFLQTKEDTSFWNLSFYCNYRGSQEDPDSALGPLIHSLPDLMRQKFLTVDVNIGFCKQNIDQQLNFDLFGSITYFLRNPMIQRINKSDSPLEALPMCNSNDHYFYENSFAFPFTKFIFTSRQNQYVSKIQETIQLQNIYDPDETFTYELIGLSIHYGEHGVDYTKKQRKKYHKRKISTDTGGHYIAQVRNNKGQYFEIDDSRVYEIQEFSENKNDGGKVYLQLYKRIDVQLNDRVPFGLRNIGNSCYLNSTFQLLLHTGIGEEIMDLK